MEGRAARAERRGSGGAVRGLLRGEDRVCLIGNLDPAGALLHGTEAEAREQAERCLAEAGPGGGFILGTGCFVAWDTPLENLKAMVVAVRETRTSFHVPPSATFRLRTGGIGPGTGPVHPKFVDQREKPPGE